MALLDQETGEVFDEETFATSLERWVELRVEEGIQKQDDEEPSEKLKEATDYITGIMVAVALRLTQKVKRDNSTGKDYLAWNQQRASLALGITHKKLQSVIKMADLRELEPMSPNLDLFDDAKSNVITMPSRLDDAGAADNDPLYQEGVDAVIEQQRCGISMLQRKLKIGYNRAARMVERMERDGVVSAITSEGVREVLR